MKKILLSFLIAIAVVGCKTNKDYYQPATNRSYNASHSFNQEIYVWENFLFPTNRTSGIQ